MNHYSEIEKLTALFQNLGAKKEAANVMANQLLKRADQMASERSISRIEALDYLLKVTIAGREGRVFEGEPPSSGTTMRGPERKT